MVRMRSHQHKQICSGALIMAKLGLLKNLTATTHPRAKDELQSFGIVVLDQPLVCHGNIATAGGCLAAIYLVGWMLEILYGPEKRDEALKEIIPVGQNQAYQNLISSSIQHGMGTAANQRTLFFSSKL